MTTRCTGTAQITAQVAGEEVVMHGGSRRGSHAQAKTDRAKEGQSRTGQGKPSQPRPGQAKGGQAKAGGRGTEPRTAHDGPAPDPDRLTRLLEPVVHALDMDLEGIRVTSAGRRRILRVVVDADGGVSLDDIALASRELSGKLDNAPEMGEQPYTLEVSSPGIDRPLTEPRHWRRAVGRLVVVPLTVSDGTVPAGNGVAAAEGRVVGSSAAGVTLEHDGVTREYAYADIGPGRVQVEFGHFSEPGDDDLTDGDPGDGEAGDPEPGDDELVEED
jgi:ribosome maturation factor RimP